MKILFLNLTQGLVDRGLERVVDLYAQALSKNNQVTVVQAGPVNPDKSYTIIRSMRLETAPQAAPYNFFEKLLFRLECDPSSVAVINFTKASIQSIKSINPDVVIACNGAPQIKILKRELSTHKIAVFGQAGMGHHDLKTLIAAPDLFIALTDAQASWCRRYIRPTTKLVVIPNPVNHIKSKKKIDLGVAHPIVLTVGALTRYKKIVSTAESLKNLAVSHVIIGDGEDGDKLQDVLSSRQSDFRWIKQVDPDLMQEYYHSCDVLCFTPDPREAFGNVYIEAMAAGLPIVATDDPVRREIIGSSGYYVNPHRPDEVGSAVLRAMSNGRIDYGPQLSRCNIKVVSKLLEKELYDLIK